jgi:hypothetical protein
VAGANIEFYAKPLDERAERANRLSMMALVRLRRGSTNLLNEIFGQLDGDRIAQEIQGGPSDLHATSPFVAFFEGHAISAASAISVVQVAAGRDELDRSLQSLVSQPALVLPTFV